MFVRYCLQRYRREREDLMYRTYVTDSLYLMGRGRYLGKRWIDMARPRAAVDVDPAVVVADVAERAGLVIS